LGHAEEEVQRGADRNAASPDWSVDGAGKPYAGSLPVCWHIAAELRDELLNGEIFYSLKEAKIVIEQWRRRYNTIRPHSALNYRPPAPQSFAPLAHHLDEIMPMQ
jgi:transposase InsO family protein